MVNPGEKKREDWYAKIRGGKPALPWHYLSEETKKEWENFPNED